MASKLKVDDLRAELTKRGLSAAGNKSALVRRLEDAIEEEAKAEIDADGGAKKRERDEAYGGDSDGVPVKKIKEVENFGDMNVKQLREQAKILGVSAAGNKKELFERLCAGFSDSDGTLDSINPKEEQEDEQEKEEEKEKEKEKDEADGRDSNDGPVKKIKAVEKFGDMNVKQLREQAKILGVSAAGTKKLLFERLCAGFLDTDGFADSINPAKEEQEDEQEKEKKKEKEKIVTATKKGAAVLDQYLPDDIKSQYHVLQLGDDVYDAMLNQTNVGDNNNKFYVIQLLESDDGSRFMVYNRWGRVGIKGQDKLFGPYTLKDAAISEFEQKFYAKTKNHWSERKEFECISKCYTWLEMDYSEKETVAVKEKPAFATAIQPRETKLETRVAKFISLICNVSMMKQQMMEIGYNANKLPLGKLSKSTILKGYGVLKRIADVIGTSDRRTLEQLSGEFYTVIPHDFGFKKMREFVIDTSQKLKHKLEMVEALGEIELATRLLENESAMQEDPLLCHYHHLGCELIPIEVDSKEYSTIAMYMQNTHAKTHSQYTVDIIQIFRVSRAGEDERFQKFSSTRNRMLLWHGSRLSNWTGILSQGLRIAPPEAPVTGYMFGKGVYFADMFSKSANYCYSTQAAPDGVLLLCEVALGDMAELLQAKYDADKLPEGKLSTKGVGGTAPDLSEAKALEDGVIVPLGKPKEQQCTKGALLYNEYIVYNVDQIRMRYVLQVNFKYTRH